jgi:hypothetical protein
MNPSQLKIKDYLLCMQQIPPLGEEDLRMAVQARARGDAWAGRLLEERFLPQVVAWVQPYRGQGLELADLISQGNRALLRALRQLRPGHSAGAVDFLESCVAAEVEAVVLARSQSRLLPPPGGIAFLAPPPYNGSAFRAQKTPVFGLLCQLGH